MTLQRGITPTMVSTLGNRARSESPPFWRENSPTFGDHYFQRGDGLYKLFNSVKEGGLSFSSRIPSSYSVLTRMGLKNVTIMKLKKSHYLGGRGVIATSCHRGWRVKPPPLPPSSTINYLRLRERGWKFSFYWWHLILIARFSPPKMNHFQ